MGALPPSSHPNDSCINWWTLISQVVDSTQDPYIHTQMTDHDFLISDALNQSSIVPQWTSYSATAMTTATATAALAPALLGLLVPTPTLGAAMTTAMMATAAMAPVGLHVVLGHEEGLQVLTFWDSSWG